LDGYGVYTWEDREYIGYWKDNKMNGEGKLLWTTGKCYDGDWVEDKKSGYGIYTWEDGQVYDGNWLDG